MHEDYQCCTSILQRVAGLSFARFHVTRILVRPVQYIGVRLVSNSVVQARYVRIIAGSHLALSP